MPSNPELPLVVESREGQRPLPFRVRRIVCGGYSSRDRSEVERHIKELERLGIARPREVPIFFSVASYLATLGGAIEVQGPFTSGEAEFVLLFGPGGPWVTVGSDQTDRFFERHSVPASKQLCPKILGGTVWPVAEVEEHWDELVLRAWVRSGRKRRLYQEATWPPCCRRASCCPDSGVTPGASWRAWSSSGHRAHPRRRAGLRRRLRAGAGRPPARPPIRTQYTVHVLESSR